MNITGTGSAEARAACDRLLGMTLPGLLRERAAEAPDSVAVRYKRHGVYRELTWSGYRDRIRRTAAGLAGLGLGPGDRLAIMGDTCIEYLLADMAAMYMGSVPCGVYPTSSAEEVAYVLGLAEPPVFLAEDQEHLDRLLAAEQVVGRHLAHRVVVVDPRALFLYDDPRIVEFATLLDRAPAGEASLAEVERRASMVAPGDVAEVIFTSGTTGYPKGACHTHTGMLYGFGFAFLESLPELRARPHRLVSHLPLAHGMERGMTLTIPLLADVVPHVGEPNQSLLSVMNEVRPSFVLGVPRVWEKLAAHVHVGVENSSRPARWLYRFASRIARRRMREVWRTGGRRAGLVTECGYRLAWLAVLWPALHKLGLTWCTGGLSGGAPLPPLVQETVEGWGIPLRDFYGTTETSVVGGQGGHWPPPDAPIEPTYRCEVRVAGDGELFVRGPGLIAGYLRDPDATREVFADDGFLGTGDIVVSSEHGRFRIVDRKKDIIITSGGKNIAPATVENALKASPYVSEVIVFGDGRKYVTALVEIDFENVAQWARRNGVPYTGFVSLAENPRVMALIGEEVERHNRRLARVEQVKHFRIIGKELEPEDGDTTPTRKVKRSRAFELFGHLVEDMYAGAEPSATVR